MDNYKNHSLGMTQDIVDMLTLPEGSIAKKVKEIDQELNNASSIARPSIIRSRWYKKSQNTKKENYSQILEQIRDRHIFSMRRALLYFLDEAGVAMVSEDNLENPEDLSAEQLTYYREKLLECARQNTPDLDKEEWDAKFKAMLENGCYIKHDKKKKFSQASLTMDDAIEIAFTLGFTPGETDLFCTRVLGENPFPPCTSKGLINYYCLYNGKTYHDAQEMQKFYEKYCSEAGIEKITREEKSVGYTKNIQDKAMIAVAGDTEEFYQFLQSIAASLDTQRATATSIYRKLAAYYANLMQSNYEVLEPFALYSRIREILEAPEEKWDQTKCEETRALMLAGHKDANALELKAIAKTEWYYLSMPAKDDHISTVPIGKRIGHLLAGTCEPAKADMLTLLYKIFHQHIDEVYIADGSEYASLFQNLGNKLSEDCGFATFYPPAFLEFSILMALCGNVDLDMFIEEHKDMFPGTDVDVLIQRIKHEPAPTNENEKKKKYRNKLKYELSIAMENIHFDLRESTELVQKLADFFKNKTTKTKVCFCEDGIYHSVPMLSRKHLEPLFLYRNAEGDILAEGRFETEESYKELYKKSVEIVTRAMEQVGYDPGESERKTQKNKVAMKMILLCVCDRIKSLMPEREMEFEVSVTAAKSITLNKWK